MTEPLIPTPDQSQDQVIPNLAKPLFEGLLLTLSILGAALIALRDGIERAAIRSQETHVRAERLAAYKARHRWKASDLRPLLSIGVNTLAQRRMIRLAGKGRPVVRPHRPLEDVIVEKVANWTTLLNEEASPAGRRRAFRSWPWWKHYVEAFYRGELKDAQARRVKDASGRAERAVACSLRMSQGTVHAICVEIRALRLEDPEQANFQIRLLAEYEEWMERGKLPKDLGD